MARGGARAAGGWQRSTHQRAEQSPLGPATAGCRFAPFRTGWLRCSTSLPLHRTWGQPGGRGRAGELKAVGRLLACTCAARRARASSIAGCATVQVHRTNPCRINNNNLRAAQPCRLPQFTPKGVFFLSFCINNNTAAPTVASHSLVEVQDLGRHVERRPAQRLSQALRKRAGVGGGGAGVRRHNHWARQACWQRRPLRTHGNGTARCRTHGRGDAARPWCALAHAAAAPPPTPTHTHTPPPPTLTSKRAPPPPALACGCRLRANPKSAILRVPPGLAADSSRFCGFRSRCGGAGRQGRARRGGRVRRGKQGGRRSCATAAWPEAARPHDAEQLRVVDPCNSSTRFHAGTVDRAVRTLWTPVHLTHVHQVVRPHLAQARRQLAHEVLRRGLRHALDAAQKVGQVSAGAELHDEVQPVLLLHARKQRASRQEDPVRQGSGGNVL